MLVVAMTFASQSKYERENDNAECATESLLLCYRFLPHAIAGSPLHAHRTKIVTVGGNCSRESCY